MIKSKVFTIGASIFGSLLLVGGIGYITLFSNSEEESSGLFNEEGVPITQGSQISPPISMDEELAEQQFNDSIYDPGDLSANALTEDQPKVWYDLSEVEKKAETEGKYGAESSGFLNFVMGKVKSIPKQTPVNTGQTASVVTTPLDPVPNSQGSDYTPSLNVPVGNVNIPTGTKQPTDSKTENKTDSKTASQSITVGSTTNLKDENGTTTSNPTSGGEFDIYDYVDEKTKIVSGTSKSEKIFEELDALSNMFVVKLSQDENIDDLLSDIVSDYEGQLLVDNLKYGRFASNDNLHYKIEVTYHISTTQKTELTKWAKSLIPKSTLTEQDKVKLVNDKVKALATYSEKGANIYSPYVLYKQGKGVCQAYASLTKFALDAMGIDNGIATGILEGVPHAWNVVYIGGQELHVDVTNNDVTSSNEFLLVSKEQIGKTHVIEKVIN